MIRVLIADDHAIVREGLKTILEETLGDVSVEEASNGVEAVSKAAEGCWDLVILDIKMPGKGGLDVLKDLKEMHPRMPVLVLSMFSEDQYAARAFKSGASGFLTKETAPRELVHAIRKVMGGGRYISNHLAERMAFLLEGTADRPPHESLSDREMQILLLIVAGKTPKQIAEELNLSVKTIGTYRERILQKMRMKSNIELAHYAIRHKLVEL